jgi:hypothetical protein
MFRMGFSGERWFGPGTARLGAAYASPLDFSPPPGSKPQAPPRLPAPPPSPPSPGQAVGPLTVNLTRAQIEDGNGNLLRAKPVPKGWTTGSPYIVKVGDKGEYVVYADGTAQYIEYGTGRVHAPVRI